MVLSDGKSSEHSWQDFQAEARAELEKSQQSLTEITPMLEQLQIEINKLAQRNTAIHVHLQQIQSQMDSLPRADIRMAYDAALDSLQRLFVMRSQLEKLTNDQQHLKRYIEVLEKTQDYTDVVKPQEELKGDNPSASVEMLINAQEAERKWLSRQMHDGPAQALSNFILQTEIAMRLFDIDQARAKDELVNLKTSAMGTFQKVRNFIFELRPMMLDDLGLVPTLKRYVDASKEQKGLNIQLQTTGEEHRIESFLEVFVFRALQEMIGNAERHSQGTQIKVELHLDDSIVRASVDDDGQGFDPALIDKSGCLGLRLIRERVEMLGGSLDIDTVAGKGTRVTLSVPIQKETVQGEPA